MFWRLGVVGSPIAHSLSPRLHEAALTSLGLEGTSEAIEIGSHDVANLKGALSSHDALSVTMPLKEVAVALCDELDDTARRVGGVNSLRMANGRVLGRATDGAGLVAAVHHEFGLALEGARVIVRGSGGSAKSIVDALVERGATVTVLARNALEATRLAERYPSIAVNPDSSRDIDLMVNTVPAGPEDTPETSRTKVAFAPDAAALDVVYEPRETPWLAARRREGLRGANGLSMLVHQAREQLQWWFDREVPLEPLLMAVGQ